MPPTEPGNRCFQCFRPTQLCYCGSVPQIQNRTSIMILQHRRERFHPFNTARIVAQALRQCKLMVDHNEELARQFNACELSENVGLLYPGTEARLLTELPPAQRPDQLVIIDGTWHHAKTLLREIPRLQTLPRYKLAPSVPGNYRIRREPNLHALSTLEATVDALKSLEPTTAGLDQLLDVFTAMIDNQIAKSSNHWRRNSRRQVGATNIPRSLTGDLSRIVVAYGERERGERHDRVLPTRNQGALIYWNAKRMVSNEFFQCAIRSPSFEDAHFLKYLRLSPEVIRDAVTPDAFRRQWKAFLRPGDQIVVHHASTAGLLNKIDANFAPQLVLKAIKLEQNAAGNSLDSILSATGICPQPLGDSRAAERLSKAIAYVQFLSTGAYYRGIDRTGKS